jgi:UDP-N-acetylglucosamine diphosphorylase / glucose-1-phosphate thymidylyltransferase / UDP-N-acetylgalactosamine diphosphorylase / glucosamine-1-phosphate N-acetyltransferase / galactosamine-1-phosphate N-acetyltransferase
MNIILFEDDLVQQLYPIVLGRPAFLVSCGSYRLIDLIGRLGGQPRAIVRSHLADVLAADLPDLVALLPPQSEPTLLVNARLVPSVKIIERLKTFLASGKSGVVHTGKSVAAALLGPQHTPTQTDRSIYEISSLLDSLKLAEVEMDLPLIEYPHDLIRWNSQILAENIADRVSRGEYREIVKDIFLAPDAHLGQHCVVDPMKGPILLDRDAVVSHFSYLAGPVYIGPRSRVIEHAAIKHGVSIGHTCKVGGELEESIIEPFTNKQHHGFLGHSYVGSWVNLGAGTCNSDLKNTYGMIKVDYSGRIVNTNMQFLGCVIGDYSKTAINTSVFTGKIIGVGSMVYGFVTTNVPSFANYARSLGQVTELPPDVMIKTQARMFARRKVEQRPCDIQLIRDMYALTRHEGQLPNKPPTL